MNSVVLFMLAFTLATAFEAALDTSEVHYPTKNKNAGLVRHFVAFRFNSSVTYTQKNEVRVKYTNLKHICVNATTGLPYIVSFDAGLPNSLEGFDQKMEQGYVVTFSSVEDRNYFVGKPFQPSFDPFHDAFKAYVGPLLYKPIEMGLIVFDFTVLP